MSLILHPILNREDYIHLIGAQVRGRNQVLLGNVVDVFIEVDGMYHSDSVILVLDTGEQVIYRNFGGGK